MSWWSLTNRQLKKIFRPFSKGLRRCIGENLALLELKLVLLANLESSSSNRQAGTRLHAPALRLQPCEGSSRHSFLVLDVH
eukprot:759477-Hanusia_phi.AAC.2